MKTKIYGYQDNNTGRIVNYKSNFVKNYDGSCAQEVTVDIPDKLEPYISVMDEICIGVDGLNIPLDSILFSKNGNPGIHYTDMKTRKEIFIMLKVIEFGKFVC